jgi:hypothetical protein
MMGQYQDPREGRAGEGVEVVHRMVDCRDSSVTEEHQMAVIDHQAQDRRAVVPRVSATGIAEGSLDRE